MGLSRLFQGPNTDFTTEPRPRPLSFPTAAAYLPIHPHPPYSAHAPHTYRTRGIDRPRGSEISKTRPLGGRRAERVEVLFDDLLALVHDPPVLDFRPCTTNPTAPHAPHTTCTRPCAGIAARSASNTRAALPTPGRAPRAVPAKGSKMAYSRTHSAGFPGTHAGSDECYVFVSEIRSVKLWGLCTGAAARGREVPLSEVHQD
jgi:hypothetical protein